MFTNAFNHFCHYLHFKKILKSYENSFIFYFNNRRIKFIEKEESITYENFIESYKGYFILHVTNDHQLLKKLTIINDDDVNLRILGGLIISKVTKLLIENNIIIISGFLLDSTFRVIPSYVTALIMISVYNARILLAFSFSATECEEIFQNNL